MKNSKIISPTPQYEDTGFKYEYLGRGQDTIVSSDIKKYPAYKSHHMIEQRKQDKRSQYYKVEPPKKNEVMMSPINESLDFLEPRDRPSIDQSVFDFYARNSFVRYIDGDEDPENLEQKLKNQMHPKHRTNKNEALVKDVRNIHISSDHQRAYVWIITTRTPVGSQVVQESTRDLWLQVYSLSQNWSSMSTISKDQSHRLQMMNNLRE